ncbi:MAG: transporter substrate-binding domain-containing protein [Methylocystaceae bacterium]|nr:transporter substrate-binding domain-containing protein [Methylocystaceae bacterium]
MALCCAFLWVSSPSKAQEGITITTDDNYPPITSTKLKYGGLGLRTVTRAFEVAGYPVKEVLWQPWARGFKLTKLNAIDAAFPWGVLPNRVDHFYFSDPFIYMINHVYVERTSSDRFVVPEDLKGKSYCNPNGYGDFGVIREYREKGLLKREEPLNMGFCFKMLATHRVDFVVAPVWDASYGIKAAGMEEEHFRRESVKIAETPLGLIVSKKNERGPEIIAAFNKGLKELSRTGELREIFASFDFLDFLPSDLN